MGNTHSKALLIARLALVVGVLGLAGCPRPEARNANAPSQPAAPDAAPDERGDQAAVDERDAPGYEFKQPSRDGTGKFYLGREIAHVMGHQAIDWLERRSREREERTDLVVDAMGLRETDVVADIGAGSGYFTFRIAPRVPKGRVIAVDIQQEMLDFIEEKNRQEHAGNIQPLLGAIDDTRLPAASVDVVLMVDAYHEFSHPWEMMRSIVRGLKPGGRVILLEYRGEDDAEPIKPLHKMTVEQVRREMEAVGLEWVETKDFLPWQHFLVFRKPSELGAQ